MTMFLPAPSVEVVILELLLVVVLVLVLEKEVDLVGMSAMTSEKVVNVFIFSC